MLHSKLLKCAALLVAFGALMVSCTKAEQIPVVKISESSVVLKPEGGEVTIPYSVENSKADVKLSVKSDSDWLVVSTVTDKEFTVVYEANKGGVEREAKITLHYPGANQVILVAKQAVQPIPFTIEISDIQATSAYMKVTPTDLTMPFIIFYMTKDEFDSYEYQSDEELIADDLAYIQEDLEYWSYDDYTSAEEMLNEKYIYTGAVGGILEGLEAETEYIIWAYGVNKDATAAVSKVVKESFTTGTLPPKEKITMTFDISVKENEDYSMSYSVIATPEDQMFYAGYWEAKGFEGMTDDEIAEAAWEVVYEETKDYKDYWGYFFPTGQEIDFPMDDLELSTEYMVICFGIDPDYGIVSNAATYKFTSPAEPVVDDGNDDSETKSVKSMKMSTPKSKRMTLKK